MTANSGEVELESVLTTVDADTEGVGRGLLASQLHDRVLQGVAPALDS